MTTGNDPFRPSVRERHRASGAGRSPGRRRGLRGGLLLSGLAGLAVVAVGAAALATAAPDSVARLLPVSTRASFTTTLVASDSGLCATPNRTGAAVTQQACDGSAAQKLRFERRNSTYAVHGPQGRCLTEPAQSKDGSPLVFGPCTRTTVVRLDQGAVAQSFRLVLPSGRCADVLTGRPEPGTVLGAWACSAAAVAGNQTFLLKGAPSGGPATSTGASTTSSSSPTKTIAPTTGTTTPAPSTSGTSTPATTEPGTTTAAPGGSGSSVIAGVATSLTLPLTRAAADAAWGKELPPAGAALGRSYSLILTDQEKGYQPRSGECSIAMHARYWTIGPDGKVYPTWHPAKDASGCSFGHEHGADPRTSVLFEKSGGWPPFGYTNELLAPSNPMSQRNEDHVGHKIAILNNVSTHPGNDASKPADQVCDTMIKFHQGTHSPDALASNLHEIFYDARCTHQADKSVTEGYIKLLAPVGKPGRFFDTNTCDGSGLTVHDHVATPAPADSFDGGVPGSRRIIDDKCAAKIKSGALSIDAVDEFWNVEVHSGGTGLRIDFNPYLVVKNPARYYDPSSSDLIGHLVDLCYEGAKGASCDKVRATTASTGSKVTWDSPDSPFNGSVRRFDPNRFVITNTGPTTVWSDIYGSRWSATEFPGAVKQYVAGSRSDDGNQGDIFQGLVANASDSSAKIHAPN